MFRNFFFTSNYTEISFSDYGLPSILLNPFIETLINSLYRQQIVRRKIIFYVFRICRKSIKKNARWELDGYVLEICG